MEENDIADALSRHDFKRLVNLGYKDYHPLACQYPSYNQSQHCKILPQRTPKSSHRAQLATYATQQPYHRSSIPRSKTIIWPIPKGRPSPRHGHLLKLPIPAISPVRALKQLFKRYPASPDAPLFNRTLGPFSRSYLVITTSSSGCRPLKLFWPFVAQKRRKISESSRHTLRWDQTTRKMEKRFNRHLYQWIGKTRPQNENATTSTEFNISPITWHPWHHRHLNCCRRSRQLFTWPEESTGMPFSRWSGSSLQ